VDDKLPDVDQLAGELSDYVGAHPGAPCPAP
jgi:hypothetical protein